jgi:hypothetical protein
MSDRRFVQSEGVKAVVARLVEQARVTAITTSPMLGHWGGITYRRDAHRASLTFRRS